MNRKIADLNLTLEEWGNLVASIYEAALLPEKWNDVVVEISKPINCHCGNLIDVSEYSVTNIINFTDGFDQSAIDDIDAEVILGINPKVNFTINRPSMTYWSDTDFTNEKEMARSSYYCKGSPVTYDTYFGGGFVIENSPGRMTAIGSFRSKDAGIFGDKESNYYRALAPHLKRAIELNKLHSIQRIQDSIISGLEALHCGALVLDHNCRVVTMNDKCQEILKRRDGLSEFGGHVVVDDITAQKELDREINNLLLKQDYFEKPSLKYILAKRTSPLPAYQLLVSPLTRAEDRLSGLYGIICIVDSSNNKPDSHQTLQQIYSLTRAEARLAIGLCDGQSLAEYAEQNCITKETARFHLKNIFAKTGTKRQAQLVSNVVKELHSLEKLSEFIMKTQNM